MNSLADAAVILSESASRDYIKFKYVALVTDEVTLLLVLFFLVVVPVVCAAFMVYRGLKIVTEKRNGTP